MSQHQPAPAFSTHQVIDQQHNIVAAAFRHPVDWQAQSQVVWNFQHYTQPLKVRGRVYHAPTGSMLEFFPVEQLCWIEPNTGFYQPGQDLNDGTSLLPVMSGIDALLRWVIPKYRGNYPGLRIIGVTQLPWLAQHLKMANATNGVMEGASVKIEFTSPQGKIYEEEFYGLKIAHQGIPTYGAAGCLVQYNWGFAKLFSFSTERGQLDAQRAQFWAIIDSVKTNPQWEQISNQILQQLKAQFDQRIADGYANIEAASRLSKQISANNQAWLDQQAQMREDSYRSDQLRRQQEQAASNAYSANDAFGDYIMGRESYDDPYAAGGVSQHDGYHNYVWTDKNGGYVRTDDANVNPNVGSDREWVLLQKKEIGK